jgi:hypothetical protein
MAKRKSSKPRVSIRKGRPKLDPRFAHLLSLGAGRLLKLQQHETRELSLVDKAILSYRDEERLASRPTGRNRSALDRLFAPLTTGVYFPAQRGQPRTPIRLREPWFSCFILSDASAGDLIRLGVRVRCQQCDIMTAFLPLSKVERLERSPAVRYIELARPWFYDLNQALPFTGIAALQAGPPPITGNGVIVGVVDNLIDFYHPDFRTAANATRLLFLWDQSLVPQAGEAGPPVAPALPGFTPTGGATFGVEYNQAAIITELNNFNPPGTPAYQTVRHQPPAPANINGTTGHGTFVTGAAAGNGLGQGPGTFTGGAPGANLIFVRPLGVPGTQLAADNTAVIDAFSYIFARATQAGQACVVNLSASDNQGPHDGTTLGEQALDTLLLTPGRAITVSAGNSTGTNAHASGVVPNGGNATLQLNYAANATASDDVEIWYDGHDTVNVTVTPPGAGVIGPVTAGNTVNAAVGAVQVSVASVANDPRNGDNLISIIINTGGNAIPQGNWQIQLAGANVINGAFNAWVDRNNRFLSAWQAPFLNETTLTLGVPSTGRRVITVGAHDKVQPTPGIANFSGRGPARDGRIKPDIATVGLNLTSTQPRNMNSPLAGQPLYNPVSGTSFSAPLVAGACAQLFECRGAAATWFDLLQILTDTAGTAGIMAPGNAFGFGFLQMATACLQPATDVDVWLRDDAGDTGAEPFAGPVFWGCPDVQVLDTAGNPVANPTHNPAVRFNNIIRVTVRNRGTQAARNVQVFLYWSDPGTNIPFPAEWRSTGIFTGAAPAFPDQSNTIVIPQLNAGAMTNVDFAWAPPAPGSNLAGDNHFCLLVRLEHPADPSNIGAGGFPSIPANNNLGLRNVGVV